MLEKVVSMLGYHTGSILHIFHLNLVPYTLTEDPKILSSVLYCVTPKKVFSERNCFVHTHLMKCDYVIFYGIHVYFYQHIVCLVKLLTMSHKQFWWLLCVNCTYILGDASAKLSIHVLYLYLYQLGLWVNDVTQWLITEFFLRFPLLLLGWLGWFVHGDMPFFNCGTTSYISA